MKVLNLTISSICMALLMVIALSPLPVLAYFAFNNDLYEEARAASAQDAVGMMPGVSTMTDAHGNPIAWFYDQHRREVPSEAISQHMKDALVAIEDRRFYEHHGVDPTGVARALVTNLQAGGVEQGSSTLEMQYVKNFNWLVSADTEEEQAQATEQTIVRKLKEMNVAADLNQEMTKDEILTSYLNLISFGNHAYGVQVGAQTYFGVDAVDLNTPQAALLAGLVQAPSQHDPYTNPEGATQRRNDVLTAMLDTGKITPEQHHEFTQAPLGILPQPATLPQGCITSGDMGFFCDYALQQLEARGFPMEDLTAGGYRITTTIDPGMQASAKTAVDSQAHPQAPDVAQVINLVEPGQDQHPIRAMATNRTYGLNEEAFETTQPITSTMVGAGAGSVAKVFTAAAALEQGLPANSTLPVPARYEASGLGTGGAAGCPPGKYCVENAGVYPEELSLTDAMAQSPNTTFIMLQEQAGLGNVVDMAVRLGMRSYAMPHTSGGERSLAQATIEDSRGSFTLGADAVDPLELANVSATLASDGMWCEPKAVEQVVDRTGQEVELEPVPCEQAVSPQVANDLTHAMSKDTVDGTAAAAANLTGWTAPVAGKTGTSEGSGSAAFLGYTDSVAGASYVFDDSANPGPICTAPLRSCTVGNVFGGMEPARGWMIAAGPHA